MHVGRILRRPGLLRRQDSQRGQSDGAVAKGPQGVCFVHLHSCLLCTVSRISSLVREVGSLGWL